MKTAVIVWDDDTIGTEFSPEELGAALVRAHEVDSIYFASVVEGISTPALCAGADPTSWDRK
jgi:hypothetical protein